MRTLREVWASVVQAEDYEGHMADVGQAQANAELVRHLMLKLSLPPNSRVLFAGAGPGQMFDYVEPSFLEALELVFTDISPGFIARLGERARRAGLRFTAVVDDIEHPSVKGPFELAVLVLVLEHVDWRKALEALNRLPTERLLVVIQENPVGMTSNASPHRELRGSLKAASDGEQAHLVVETELLEHTKTLGYSISVSERRAVLDGKFMCGFVFS